MKRIFATLSAMILTLAHSCMTDLEAADVARPNILVIVSDDHGYADIGFQGGKDVATPNLDALATSGLICTNGYVTHSFCSPTRAALLTGRYQHRFGHEHNPVYDPLDELEGLPLSERLLPEFLKPVGYTTGWIGKWHLGSSPKHIPKQRGFEETFGFIGGGHRFMGWQPNERQYTLPLARNGESITDVPEHLTTAFGEEASSFVHRNHEKPWMLYLAFNAPHTPHEPTAERIQKYAHIEDATRRKYLAQVSLLDDAIGSVIKAIADSNQAERTLIFFFSDNGGHEPSGSDNGPLRGMKGQLYEGGIRVPFLVSWPSKLPRGKHYDSPVSSLDVFATSLAVAGVSMPKDRKYDGVNLVPYLAGDVKSAPHERLYWRMFNKKTSALRDGNWKLLRQADDPLELYDLSSDLAESRNLALEKPDLTQQLVMALDAWEQEMIAPIFPGSTVKSEDWGPGGANQNQRKASGGKSNAK